MWKENHSDKELQRVEKQLRRKYILRLDIPYYLKYKGVTENPEIKLSGNIAKDLMKIIRATTSRDTRYVRSGNLQCDAGRERSQGDLYNLMRYYHPNLTFKEFRLAYLKLINQGLIRTIYCNTIERKVTSINSNYKFMYYHPEGNTQVQVYRNRSHRKVDPGGYNNDTDEFGLKFKWDGGGNKNE